LPNEKKKLDLHTAGKLISLLGDPLLAFPALHISNVGNIKLKLGGQIVIWNKFLLEMKHAGLRGKYRQQFQKETRKQVFTKEEHTHTRRHAQLQGKWRGLECWCCCGAKKKEKLIRGKQRKSQQKVSNLIRVRMCGWLFEFVCSQENYQCCKVVKLSLLFTQKNKKKTCSKIWGAEC